MEGKLAGAMTMWREQREEGLIAAMRGQETGESAKLEQDGDCEQHMP